MPRVKVVMPSYVQSVKTLTHPPSTIHRTPSDGTFTWLIVLIACIVWLMLGIY